MGHLESLEKQVHNNLYVQRAMGESKHADKIAGSTQNKIYSYNTLHTYEKHCNKFVEFCRNTYGCRTLKQCRRHVQEYVNARSGCSEWTRKLDISAIGKLYGESRIAECGSRERADIVRSRAPAARDRHFSEERHADFVEFCRCTGLRRHEVAYLRGDHVIERDGKYFVRVDCGKGGRSRDAEIIGTPAQIERVVERIRETPAEDHVWDHVPQCDIHSYRRDYANTLYQREARDVNTLDRSERWECKKDMQGIVYDKAAMAYVSEQLGHSRIDVIASSYLKK